MSLDVNVVSINKHKVILNLLTICYFSFSGSAQLINKWIREVTKDHIRDLVTEDSVSNSIILLINALYFEGTWRFGFNKTRSGSFFTAPGTKVEKSFIEQTGMFYYFYSKKLNAKILRLPYNGRRYSMFIILPNEANDLDGVIDRLDSRIIKDEIWHLDESGNFRILC